MWIDQKQIEQEYDTIRQLYFVACVLFCYGRGSNIKKHIVTYISSVAVLLLAIQCHI